MTLLLSVLYQENNHKADQWYEYFFGWAEEEVQEKILTLNHSKTEKEVGCAYSRSVDLQCKISLRKFPYKQNWTTTY